MKIVWYSELFLPSRFHTHKINTYNILLILYFHLLIKDIGCGIFRDEKACDCVKSVSRMYTR